MAKIKRSTLNICLTKEEDAALRIVSRTLSEVCLHAFGDDCGSSCPCYGVCGRSPQATFSEIAEFLMDNVSVSVTVE